MSPSLDERENREFASEVKFLVLELKFRCAMPALFKLLVEEFALNPEPFSKYRLAAAALNLVRDPDDAALPDPVRLPEFEPLTLPASEAAAQPRETEPAREPEPLVGYCKRSLPALSALPTDRVAAGAFSSH